MTGEFMEAAAVNADYDEASARHEDAKGVFVIALHAAAQVVFHSLDCAKLTLVRVVLDTNVLLSACLKPEGLEARVVDMALAGEAQVCVTAEVFDEYRDVLRRDKFRACRERAEELLARMERCALTVEAGEVVTAASDDDDNRFLECAAAGHAEYLITGNLRHYPSEWGTARIVNARGFYGTGRSGPARISDIVIEKPGSRGRFGACRPGKPSRSGRMNQDLNLSRVYDPEDFTRLPAAGCHRSFHTYRSLLRRRRSRLRYREKTGRAADSRRRGTTFHSSEKICPVGERFRRSFGNRLPAARCRSVAD